MLIFLHERPCEVYKHALVYLYKSLGFTDYFHSKYFGVYMISLFALIFFFFFVNNLCRFA